MKSSQSQISIFLILSGLAILSPLALDAFVPAAKGLLAIVSALLSLFSDDTAIPLGSAIAICRILTLITSIIIFSKSSKI